MQAAQEQPRPGSRGKRRLCQRLRCARLDSLAQPLQKQAKAGTAGKASVACNSHQAFEM